jgi:corrinoid protein of di/trimethylamine methyltransferase
MSSEREQIFRKISQTILEGDEVAAKTAAENALDQGIDPVEAIKEGAAKGMEVVGEKFKNFEIFLPQVILAADAMKAIMAVLVPKISEEKRGDVYLGKAVIGTAFGDIHDIGKNLVATTLAVAGFEVEDLGCDVPAKQFIQKADEVSAGIIGISTLLSSSLYYQEDVINYLTDSGKREKYFIIVGGGPVTAEWTTKIKADGYGKYAEDAVELCKKLVSDKKTPPLLEPVIIGE